MKESETRIVGEILNSLPPKRQEILLAFGAMEKKGFFKIVMDTITQLPANFDLQDLYLKLPKDQRHQLFCYCIKAACRETIIAYMVQMKKDRKTKYIQVFEKMMAH